MQKVNKIIPALLFIALSALMLCCTPARPYLYTVIEPYMYEDLYQKGLYQKYILIEESYSPELREALDHVSLGKKRKARSILRKMAKGPESYFLAGVLYMEKKKFEEAGLAFDLASQNTHFFQADLLKLDCKREQEIELNYMEAYQHLYDRAPDPLYRKIIKDRFKFYRYEL